MFRSRHGLKVSFLFRGVSCEEHYPSKNCFTTEKYWYCDDCDQVIADARKKNSTNPFYDSLDMTCPDGEIETIDISREKVYEIDAIRAELPAYCRKNCDNVFKVAN